MSTLEVSSSEGQGQTAKILDAAFKVSRFQSFKFEVTKSHGKYQHSNC